jgi:DNA-binding NarL/FixJ family response regulator
MSRELPTDVLPHRVLLVDDQVAVSGGLEALFSAQTDLRVCGRAATGAEVLRLLGTVGADAVILEWSVENGAGVELIREISSRFPGVAVLVSSVHDETLVAERALRAGALGCINTQVAGDEILTALRRVLRGQIYLSGDLTDRLIRRGLGTYDHKRNTVEDLSERELQVFELVGQGQRTSDIAGRLGLSVKTIETYRQRIKDKLHLKNGADLARCAAQWAMENPPPAMPSAGV